MTSTLADTTTPLSEAMTSHLELWVKNIPETIRNRPILCGLDNRTYTPKQMLEEFKTPNSKVRQFLLQGSYSRAVAEFFDELDTKGIIQCGDITFYKPTQP